MTLSVPRAGTDPGRAARAVPQPVAQDGSNIAQLGQVLSGIGNRLQADRLDRQIKRAQVDATAELNDLRLEVEQIGDPDQADALWGQRVEEIKAGFVGPEGNGSDRLDRQSVETFGLAFDDLANRHKFQVGARNLALRQSQRVATYNDYVFAASQTAQTSDKPTREELFAQGAEHINGLVAAGIWDAERAQIELMNLNGRLDDVAAFEAYNTDPATFLEMLDRDEFDALDPKTETRMRAAAQNDLRKAAEAAQQTADQAAREARKATTSTLNQIASIGDANRLSPDLLAVLDDPQVAAMAEEDPDVNLAFRKAQARVSLDSEAQAFATATPDQLRAAIEQERNAKVTHPFQEERLAVLEDHLEHVEQALETDAVTHLAEVGYAVPALDLAADREALTGQLQRRLAFGQSAQERGFTTGAPILSDAEKQQLTEILAPSADPSQRQATLAAFASLGPTAQPVIQGATGDPLLGHVAHLMTQGASPSVIRAALDGQKRLADKTVNAPKPAEFRAAFRAATDDMFFDTPELENRVLSTARAFYATMDPESDDIDASIAEQAVNMALGGDGTNVGGLTTIDGRGLFGSYDLPVPPGLNHRGLDAALRRLDIQLAGRPERGSSAGVAPSADLLAAASLTGAPPALDPDRMSDQFDRLQIQPLFAGGQPTDRYVLVRQTPQGPIALQDTAGGRFEFSLRKLVREGRQ
ncbi:MAG: hypothetical protein AAF582_00160 [Pseudomonadota bacterium]